MIVIVVNDQIVSAKSVQVRPAICDFTDKTSIFFQPLLKLLVILSFIVLCGCAVPRTESYRSMYAYLDQAPVPKKAMQDSEYFLVLAVDARHLDYTDNYSFLKTLAKHPSDGSKCGDVGHAWLYVQGVVEGKAVYIEGGHSGELGVVQAKYFAGIMNNIDYGYANPTSKEIQQWRYEPNPIKYLWETLKDGFFQVGAGSHKATFAAKVDLKPDQFQEIMNFIYTYDFSDYSITGNQCSSFVARVASLANLELECQVTMPIDAQICIVNEHIILWNDPCYSQLTISSPDVLERSLMQVVHSGQAENATCWFNDRKKPSWDGCKWNIFDDVARFPLRYARIKSL